MARPRTWERGEGTVQSLAPSHVMLSAVKKGDVSIASYRDDFIKHVPRGLGPGTLVAKVGSSNVTVTDGDTLCCSCSRDAARAGQCHRVWAAELLRRQGWEIVLDGQVFVGVDSEWRPILGAEVRTDV